MPHEKKLLFNSRVAAALIAFVVVLPTLTIGYFADDFDFAIQAAGGFSFSSLATTNTVGETGGGSWRPISRLFIVTPMMFSKNTIIQHFISVLLYVAIVYCAVVLFREWNHGASFVDALLVGILVAVTAYHVEAVAWVSARADLLAAIFGLCAMIFWQRDRIFGAVIFFAASMLSKEVWLFLPFVWAAQYIFETYKKTDNFLKKQKIMGLITACVILFFWFIARNKITGYFFGGYSAPDVFDFQMPFRTTLNAIKFFIGFPLPVDLFDNGVYFVTQRFALICVLLALFILWRIVKSQLGERISIIALFMTLLPVAALPSQFLFGMASVAEDRYWFAPSIFLAFIIVSWLTAARGFLKYILTAAVILLIAINAVAFVKKSSYFIEAAQYRDNTLAAWKRVSHPSDKDVALLPDSHHGVHLFASPFFERALEWHGLEQPRSVLRVFSISGWSKPEHVFYIMGEHLKPDKTLPYFAIKKADYIKKSLILVVPTDGYLALWNGTEFDLYRH